MSMAPWVPTMKLRYVRRHIKFGDRSSKTVYIVQQWFALRDVDGHEVDGQWQDLPVEQDDE